MHALLPHPDFTPRILQWNHPGNHLYQRQDKPGLPSSTQVWGAEGESCGRGFGLCTRPALQRAWRLKFYGCTTLLSLTCACEHLSLEGGMAVSELSALGQLLWADCPQQETPNPCIWGHRTQVCALLRECPLNGKTALLTPYCLRAADLVTGQVWWGRWVWVVAPLLIGEQAHKADAALPSSRVSVLLSQMLCKVDPLLNVFRKPGVLPACGILCLLPLTLLCVSQNVAMRPKTLPNTRMLFAFFFFFLLFILSMVYGRIFQRLCDMWWWNVRVHWCFKMLSVWISSMVNTDEYNPQKQSSWRSLIVQKSVREFWGQGVRELLVHCQSEHLCPRVQVQACSCGSWLLCIVSWRDLSPFHNESFYCTGPFS